MHISVALADDNVPLLHALARNLAVFSEVTVLFTATDGQQALEMARQQPPDVLLMDIDMPILDGIRAFFAGSFSGTLSIVFRALFPPSSTNGKFTEALRFPTQTQSFGLVMLNDRPTLPY